MRKILFLFGFMCLHAVLFGQHTFSTTMYTTDNIAIATDVYLPDSTGRFSTILIRTPYTKEGSEIFAEFFQNEGFAVVVQDVRGKNKSEGVFIPFVNEYADGYDALDWVGQQPWSNQEVGMWGSSYLAYSALMMAQSGHPNLKSVFNLSGWIDGDQINAPGGAMHQMLVIPWLLFEGQKTRQPITGLDLDDIYNHLPLKEVFPAMEFAKDEKAIQRMDEIDFSNGEYRYSKVEIPVFHMGGWFDFATPATIAAYQALRSKSNIKQQAIFGPWYHNQIYDGNRKLGIYRLPKEGRTGVEEMLAIASKWFKTTLDSVSQVEDKIDYYVLFENAWHSSKCWPPAASDQTMYLAPQKLYDAPHSESATASYVFDPMNPVSTMGGANFHFFLDNIGLQNQGEVEERLDVLTYNTSMAEVDTRYAGSVRAKLFVSTAGKGTDFTAKLCIVDSAGVSLNLLDGIIRVSPESCAEPIFEIEIYLGEIAFQLEKGKHLRLQISSSNFPKYNRNPNTGIDPMDAKTLQTVKQTIHYSERYPSQLILPFLKTSK